jgi:hypothetical protein
MTFFILFLSFLPLTLNPHPHPHKGGFILQVKTIRKFLGLCDHDWVEIEQKKVIIHLWERPASISGYQIVYIFQCQKCKKLKKQVIKY